MGGASQDRMRSFSKPTPMNFMYYVNLWGILFCMIGIITCGEAPKFIDFIVKHPNILQYLGLAVLVGAAGQVFKSSMVVYFGSLPLSIAQTLRKFFNVLLSVILFGNSLSIQQWLSVGVIFGALFIDAILNKIIKTQNVSNLQVDENFLEPINLEENNKENIKTEIYVITAGFETNIK